jgi:hypothetical protein
MNICTRFMPSDSLQLVHLSMLPPELQGEVLMTKA